MPAPESVKELIGTQIATTDRLVYEPYNLASDEITLVEETS